ncbi:hypothetical protein DFH07DRAFT_1032211 [Mycena maculata]|uniref:C2H2-type domain-containing protein n=1 Tax=Mycena maculata TaxID=230809 RepID=A0AAD7N9R2_9AGAR|nr:hypothetical protein DFH07DRAFT_1032211 [Mycena maculata]
MTSASNVVPTVASTDFAWTENVNLKQQADMEQWITSVTGYDSLFPLEDSTNSPLPDVGGQGYFPDETDISATHFDPRELDYTEAYTLESSESHQYQSTSSFEDAQTASYTSETTQEWHGYSPDVHALVAPLLRNPLADAPGNSYESFIPQQLSMPTVDWSGTNFSLEGSFHQGNVASGSAAGGNSSPFRPPASHGTGFVTLNESFPKVHEEYSSVSTQFVSETPVPQQATYGGFVAVPGCFPINSVPCSSLPPVNWVSHTNLLGFQHMLASGNSYYAPPTSSGGSTPQIIRSPAKVPRSIALPQKTPPGSGTMSPAPYYVSTEGWSVYTPVAGPSSAPAHREKTAAHRQKKRDVRKHTPLSVARPVETGVAPHRGACMAGPADLTPEACEVLVKQAEQAARAASSELTCEWDGCTEKVGTGPGLLMDHLQTAHGVVRDMTVQCLWGQSCTNEAPMKGGSLVKHLQTEQHLKRKLQCPLCHAPLARRDALRRHISGGRF